MFKALLCLLALSALSATALCPRVAAAEAAVAGAASAWVEDFQEAQAKAEKENKDLLMDFTGSDWCGWCIKLRKEVFNQDAFMKEAPKNFVLVELDYPQRKPQPEKIRAQNKLLASAFKIEGYPTVFLADAQGRAYARLGYQEGGPEPYLATLEKARASKKTRDDLFAKAATSSGLEKAKLLDAALGVAEQNEALIGYDETISEIMKLDADGKGELKTKYQLIHTMEELNVLMQKNDPKGALEKVDAALATNLPEDKRQQLFFIKAKLMISQGDKAGTLAALEAARKANPESELGKKIPEFIEQVKAAEGKPEKAAEK